MHNVNVKGKCIMSKVTKLVKHALFWVVLLDESGDPDNSRILAE